MARSPRELVFHGRELLHPALVPFVEHHLARSLGANWRRQVLGEFKNLKTQADGEIKWDLATLLRTLADFFWYDVFATVLPRAARSQGFELIDVRNRFAFDEPFSLEDADRALDTMQRLARAIGAADVAGRLKELRDTAAAKRTGQPVPARQRPPTQGPEESPSPQSGTQADAIRAFVVANYARPAQAKGMSGFVVRAGDVHAAMRLSNAMPNVCSALGGGKFVELAGVRLAKREGPRAGANVFFHFEFR